MNGTNVTAPSSFSHIISTVSVDLGPRVENLETLMADTLRVVRETSLEVSRVSRATGFELDRLSREMREFKDEMREFKIETRNDRREMNRRWGDLAASLGILIEDIVAPSVPCVLREVFGCPPEAIEFSGVRVRRKHPTFSDRNREFDTIVVGCGIFVTVESKSKPTVTDVNDFVDRLSEVKEYFPDYGARGFRFMGALASLYIDPSLVNYAERRGLIVLGTGDDLMTVLNSPGFVPRAF